MFQSTRPRGARLKLNSRPPRRPVSIHAPTWGATAAIMALGSVKMFQSTRPRGARLIRKTQRNNHLVSIHAPTWGATGTAMVRTRAHQVSIHAPTWGATNNCLEDLNNNVFQSTRPRGARPCVPIFIKISCCCFNPRAHVGRDFCCQLQQYSWTSFNPRAHVGRDS